MTDPLDAGDDDDLTIAAGPELDALMEELSQSRRDRDEDNPDEGEDDSNPEDDLTVFGDAADEASQSLEPDRDDFSAEDDEADDDATVFERDGDSVSADEGFDLSDDRSDRTDQPFIPLADLDSEPESLAPPSATSAQPQTPEPDSFQPSTPPPPPPPGAAQVPPPSAGSSVPPQPVVADAAAVPPPAARPIAMSAAPSPGAGAEPWVPPASFPSPRREPPTAVASASRNDAARLGRIAAVCLALVVVAAAGWMMFIRDSTDVENQPGSVEPTPVVDESSG